MYCTWLMFSQSCLVNPLMPGVHYKATYSKTNPALNGNPAMFEKFNFNSVVNVFFHSYLCYLLGCYSESIN